MTGKAFQNFILISSFYFFCSCAYYRAHSTLGKYNDWKQVLKTLLIRGTKSWGLLIWTEANVSTCPCLGKGRVGGGSAWTLHFKIVRHLSLYFV